MFYPLDLFSNNKTIKGKYVPFGKQFGWWPSKSNTCPLMVHVIPRSNRKWTWKDRRSGSSMSVVSSSWCRLTAHRYLYSSLPSLPMNGMMACMNASAVKKLLMN